MLKLNEKQRDIICEEMGWNDEPEMQEDLRDWKQYDWVLTIPGSTPGLENDDIYVDEEFPYLVGFVYYGQFYGICNIGTYILSLIAQEIETPQGGAYELSLQQKKVLFVELGWLDRVGAAEDVELPWLVSIPGELIAGWDPTSVTDEYPFTVGLMYEGKYIVQDYISLALWQELLHYPDRQISDDKPQSKGQAFSWLINKGGKK